jgi:hypothetical protein
VGAFAGCWGKCGCGTWGVLWAVSLRQDRAKPQKHLFVHRYLCASDWAVLQDPAKDVGAKFKRVVNRAHAFGLLHPTELTYVHMLSAVLASTRAEFEFLRGSDALAYLRDLKTFFKLNNRRGLLKRQIGPTTFPPDVEEFRRTHQEPHAPTRLTVPEGPRAALKTQ